MIRCSFLMVALDYDQWVRQWQHAAKWLSMRTCFSATVTGITSRVSILYPSLLPETPFREFTVAEGDRGIFDLLNGQMQDKYSLGAIDLGAQVIPDDLAGGGRQIGKAIVDYLDTCHQGATGILCVCIQSKGGLLNRQRA